MKRTLSGSRAQKAIEVSKGHHQGIESLRFESEVPQIPPKARKYIEYLSQFPLSQVCQWVDIWQKAKVQEDSGIVPMNYYLRNNDQSSLEAKLETWPTEIAEELSNESEQFHSNSISPTSRISVHKHDSYPCSFCNKTFRRKGSWKRHEESFHEPQKQWHCLEPGCNRTFTAGNKFRQHHRSDHACESCNHDHDPAVVSNTQITSVWGCGFCAALLTTWDIRANHIGSHFETGSKRSDWDFSRVVQGLLQQPTVFEAWQSLLKQFHGTSGDNRPLFTWSVESSQGLLKSLQAPVTDQSAKSIVESAYILGAPLKPKNEPNFFSLLTDPYSFLGEEKDQYFSMDPIDLEGSVPESLNTIVNGNEVFQLGEPLAEIDEVEVSSSFSGEGHVIERAFENSKSYITPCGETFEPTEWFFWPSPNLPLDNI